MFTVVIYMVIAFIAGRVGIVIGRWQTIRQMELHEETQFVWILQSIKRVADDNLRQFAAHTSLHLHIGDQVVDCKSTTEVAQFSEATKHFLGWFKPVEEVHPPSAT